MRRRPWASRPICSMAFAPARRAEHWFGKRGRRRPQRLDLLLDIGLVTSRRSCPRAGLPSVCLPESLLWPGPPRTFPPLSSYRDVRVSVSSVPGRRGSGTPSGTRRDWTPGKVTSRVEQAAALATGAAGRRPREHRRRRCVEDRNGEICAAARQPSRPGSAVQLGASEEPVPDRLEHRRDARSRRRRAAACSRVDGVCCGSACCAADGGHDDVVGRPSPLFMARVRQAVRRRPIEPRTSEGEGPRHGHPTSAPARKDAAKPHHAGAVSDTLPSENTGTARWTRDRAWPRFVISTAAGAARGAAGGQEWGWRRGGVQPAARAMSQVLRPGSAPRGDHVGVLVRLGLLRRALRPRLRLLEALGRGRQRGEADKAPSTPATSRAVDRDAHRPIDGART